MAFFYSFHSSRHHSRKGVFTVMKKLWLFPLILALGLIFVHSLQADTIDYTFKSNFQLPIYPVIDPLGIGSGTGTAILNFVVAPPPSQTEYLPNYYSYSSIFNSLISTLTLMGTNVDGTYNTDTTLHIDNAISSIAPPGYWDGMLSQTKINLSGNSYEFYFGINMPQSFWEDSEVPPLPKLISNDMIEASQLLIYSNLYSSGPNYISWNVDVDSQIIPIPGSVWLLASGLLGLKGWKEFKKN